MGWADVTAISFDLGGTLIHDARGPATQEIGDLFGVGLPQMRAHLGRDAKRARQNPTDLARRVAGAFDRPDLADEVARILQRRRADCTRPTLVPHADSVLAELRRRGYRIAFLSNVLGAIAPPTDNLLFRMADVVLMSCDTGHVKPERAAFAAVERALSTGPGQLAHVGDSWGADVQGAVAGGWHAVHLDPAGVASAAPGHGMGDGRWRRRPDLPSLLDLFPPVKEVAP